ncbi:hypothetical protein MASR2M78_11640 [Treponema sp.]
MLEILKTTRKIKRAIGVTNFTTMDDFFAMIPPKKEPGLILGTALNLSNKKTRVYW